VTIGSVHGTVSHSIDVMNGGGEVVLLVVVAMVAVAIVAAVGVSAER